MISTRVKQTIVVSVLLAAAVLVAAAAARPSQRQQQWEYAVFVGADDGRAAWVSADTILIESDMRYMLLGLGDVDLPDWEPGDERWGPRILNYLGANGWELTDVESGGFRGDNLGPLDEPHRTYYLKREAGGR